MKIRILGLGQAFAGNDAVGLRVLDELEVRAARCEPEAELVRTTELVRVNDATELIELLRFDGAVLVIDALVGSTTPGRVEWLDVAALDERSLSRLSSHGVSVSQAIELCRTLHPESFVGRLCILGIHVGALPRAGEPMSLDVQQAVRPAVQSVLERLAALRACA